MVTKIHIAEAEYISRKAFKLGMPAAKYVRRKTIPQNWMEELISMREEQGILPKMAGRPKHVGMAKD